MKNFSMKTIRMKLIIRSCTLIFFAAAVLCGISIKLSTDSINKNIHESLSYSSKNAAEIVGIKLSSELKVLEQIAGRTRISNQSNSMEDRIKALADDLERNKYLRLAFVDMKGLANYSDGTKTNLSDRAYVKDALEGKSNVSETIVSKVDGSVVMAFATPVFQDKKVVGAVIAIRPGEYISKEMQNINVGGTSYTFIVSKTGIIQAHTDQSLVSGQFNFFDELKNEQRYEKLVSLIKKMTSGEQGVDAYWFNGETKLMGYSSIQGTTWGVGVTIPEKEVFAGVKQLQTLLIVMTIAILIVANTVFWFIGTNIANPIVQATEYASIMAKGDYTNDIPQKLLERKDEIGKLGNAFYEVTLSSRKLIGKVIDLSHQLASSSQEISTVSGQVLLSSNEIAKTVEEIAHGASSQSFEVEKGAHQTIELGKLIDDSAEMINALKSSSSIIQEKVVEGLESVNILLSKAKETKISTQIISEVIQTTDASSRKIGEASSVITMISNQTNLLALNAAIEAARAGENGRGFSVVAEEIRKLAEQSSESTKSIDKIVAELQKNSLASVETVTKLINAIEQQLVRVGETDAKYLEISEAVNDSMHHIQELNQRSKNMMENKDVIVEVVNGLSAIAEENAAATEEVSSSVYVQGDSLKDVAIANKRLSEMAKELSHEASKFKV
jgi:methyl-accepting chemotaxis protein